MNNNNDVAQPRANISDKICDRDLTFDEVNALVRYEPETGEFFSRETGENITTKCGPGYRAVRIAKRQYYAHRLAHLLMTGECAPHMMDHKNGRRDCNIWSNLRPATPEQNCTNRASHSNNKTGYRGVQYCPKCPNRPWRAQIGHQGYRLELGCFTTPEAAANAYNEAAAALFGDFAPVRAA